MLLLSQFQGPLEPIESSVSLINSELVALDWFWSSTLLSFADEFIFNMTHDRVVDWLLPGVPPSGRKLAIPMMSVVNVRGDRLYHEHIWWDQAGALKQVGILPTHVPYPPPDGKHNLRLPIAGIEAARLLVDETAGRSNEMLEESWGVSNN